MKKLKLEKWDSADYLKTKKDVVHYLEAAFEDGDPELIVHAFGNIARAKGVAEISKKTRLDDGKLGLLTILKVVRALGLKLKIAA